MAHKSALLGDIIKLLDHISDDRDSNTPLSVKKQTSMWRSPRNRTFNLLSGWQFSNIISPIAMLTPSENFIGSQALAVNSILHIVLSPGLKSGGTMKLYEAHDAFEKDGGTYEHAQVVHLDSCW
eukprot:5735634-Ditylum_brightwellii.AAC.1